MAINVSQYEEEINRLLFALAVMSDFVMLRECPGIVSVAYT
jgi:hypothetical protein